MRSIIILIVAILLQGCFPSFKPKDEDRLYLKEIDSSPVKLEWFFYSSAYTDSPDLITISIGEKVDTICKATNISDLKLINNKIKIGFYGQPILFEKKINLSSYIMNYEILVDTSYVLNDLKPRKFYKKY